MKPLRLLMQAFGPFSGTEEIRFAELGDAPLFLINGPTGSGKTTILDAICYALYGSTTGDERQGTEMRCQLSDPGLLTRVEFEFELGGRVYLIKRLPDQLRPKQRGEGSTLQKTRATLYRLGPDGDTESGELLADQKVQEANRHIRDLTGLNAEQFRQVMVLPQGQFRKLLVADSKEKQQIFESLFSTAVFRRIEEELKAASADIRRDRERGLAMIQGILESGGIADESELQVELAALEEPLQAAMQEREVAQQAWEKCAESLTRARELQSAFERLDQAKLREKELDALAEDIDRLRRQLEMAVAAAALMPLFGQRDRLAAARDKAQDDLARGNDTLETAGALHARAQEVYREQGKRAGEQSELQKTLHVLQGYLPKIRLLEEAQEQLLLARGDYSTAETRHECAAGEKRGHDESRIRLEKDIERLRSEIEAAAGVDAQLLHLRQVRAQLDTLAELEEQLAANRRDVVLAEQAAVHAGTEREQANRDLKHLRRLWHEGQAALLAAELEEGAPCAVCGSTKHPSPAVPRDDCPTSDDLETGQEKVDSLDKVFQQAASRQSALAASLDSLEEQRSVLLSRLGENGEAKAGEIAQRLQALEERAGNARRAVEQLASARQHLAKLEQAGIAIDERQVAAAHELRDSGAAVTAADTRARLAEADLPEEYRDSARLNAHIDATEKRLAELQAAVQSAADDFHQAVEQKAAAEKAREHAQARLEEVTRDVSEASDVCEQAVSSSPFATEQECRLAVMDPKEEIAQRALIEEHDRERISVSATRAALERQLDGRRPQDLSVLEETERGARAERDRARGAADALEERRRSLENTRLKVSQQRERMAALDEQYAVVGTLADVAGGHTGSRVSLQRWVLGVLLDDVLVQATQRLMKMSDGRYQLLRQRESSSRNRAAGLDLEVYDDYTGEVRPVTTLSGGESFMAALSLALGLSDVVQAQSGGIRLDTLFVDEGFGTLDSQALELAVATLLELREAGRIVGIISHVSELKEQIDVRIDLSMDRGGSTLRIVSPAAG